MVIKQQGIITGHQNDIIEFQEVIGTNTTFSSYPTAYEDRSQKFNPSQIDYVIHALGKKYMTQYKNDFLNENPKYFLNPTVIDSYWHTWVWFANFELYELVFANYKPILLNDFGVIWEKQTTENVNLVNVPEPKIGILSNNTENITIEVSYPPNILPKDFPFYMTVISVDYESISQEGVPFYNKNMKHHVNFHYNYDIPYKLAYLRLEGVSRNFSRPGDGKLNVPVMIDKNGVGKVFISANTYNINIKSVDYVSTLKQYIFVRGLLKDQKGVQNIDRLIQQYNLTNK